nr:hypothetical protein Iba_chr13dCG6140 [Ipomoea batatas]
MVAGISRAQRQRHRNAYRSEDGRRHLLHFRCTEAAHDAIFFTASLRRTSRSPQSASGVEIGDWPTNFSGRRTERDTPLGSAAAVERRRVLRQGYPPNCSATDEHCCFVWPGEESKADAATNHVTTKQRWREKPPPFKTSRCIATWSTSKVEAAAALASSHVAGKIGNTPVGVPRCRRLGAALTAAHLHSLFRRQRCRLLQEEIATGCSSSVPAALTEWRRNNRRSVLLPLLLCCEGNR